MPLGVEVGLGPGDFVLDGDPAFPIASFSIVTGWQKCLLVGFFAAQWKNNLWHWAAVTQQTNHHKNNLYLLPGTANLIIGQ